MDRESKNQAGAVGFWSGGTSKQRDFAHWRGVGRWNEKAWLSVGKGNLQAFWNFRHKHDNGGCLQRMLEWGPGGGCNVSAFGSQFANIHGVDLSSGTLETCHFEAAKRRATDLDVPFHFIGQHIDPNNPEAVAGQGPFDFMLCTAVVQHMPSHAWVGRFLKVTSGEMRKGGQAMVEFKTTSLVADWRLKNSSEGEGEYATNVARWCLFHPAKFVALCEASGWRVLEDPCKPVSSVLTYGLMIYLEKK